MLISIVTPTYNEALNVKKFIHSLEVVPINKEYEIIFVDDNSEDKTYLIVKNIAKNKKNIRCIRRIGRRGLSSAVIEGSLSSSADLLLIMDADLQHDPVYVDDFMTVDSEVNLVIGARNFSEKMPFSFFDLNPQ